MMPHIISTYGDVTVQMITS